MSKISWMPCPICKTQMFIIGTDKSGKKLTSCSHRFKFKKTKSEKKFDKKYIKTEWGLELIEIKE